MFSGNHQLSSAATPIAPSRDQNFYTSSSYSQQQQLPSVSSTPQIFHQQQRMQHQHQPYPFNSSVPSSVNTSTSSMLNWNTGGNNYQQQQQQQNFLRSGSTTSTNPPHHHQFMNTSNNTINNDQHQQQQQQFLLVVNTVDGKKYKLVSRQTDIRRLSPLSIKKFVKMVANIPEDVQILRFGGNILGDNISSCGDVGINSGDVIALDDLRMYSNNDQVQRLQQEKPPLQHFHSGNLAYGNGPPESLQDLARGFHGGSGSEQQQQHININSNQQAFLNHQQNHFNNQQQHQNQSAQHHYHHQEESHNNISNSNQSAATSIIQLQKRLLEKETELKLQQDALQRILQEATEREAKKLDESNVSQQSAAKELMQMKEEMKKVEQQARSATQAATAALDASASAMQSLQSSRQNSPKPSQELNHHQQQHQIQTSSLNPNTVDDTTQQQLSPRGSALTSSSSASFGGKLPPSPPKIKKQPSGSFSPPKVPPQKPSMLNNNNNNNNNTTLAQDAIRIASSNSSSSALQQQTFNTNNNNNNNIQMIPLKERAYKLVTTTIQKLILHSKISSESISDETLNSSMDTWTVDLLPEDESRDEASSSVNSLLFSYDEESKRLYLYTTLLHFIPSDPHLKLALYELLLEGALMGREMAGGGVGVSSRSNLVLMATSVDVRFCNGFDALAEIVGTFIDSARSWSKAAMKVLHGDDSNNHNGRRVASY